MKKYIHLAKAIRVSNDFVNDVTNFLEFEFFPDVHGTSLKSLIRVGVKFYYIFLELKYLNGTLILCCKSLLAIF